MFLGLIDTAAIHANNAELEGSSSSGRMPRFFLSEREHPVRIKSRLVLFQLILISSYLFFFFEQTSIAVDQTSTKPVLDAKRAFSYLVKICDLGSRTTGSDGMRKQQSMLEKHFTKLGATLVWQDFDMRHPENGENIVVRNLIVQWEPKKTERVLLCTHYDTRPFPVNDPRNPKGLFVGANDGGSGTALFMELGHVLQNLPLNVGVDLVFFDAEEIVYDEQRDPFFIGSKYFSQAYADDASSPRYRNGILVDMIADADLQLFHEKNSLKYAGALVEEVWGIAKELKIKEFKPSIGYEIKDDHLPLNSIAKIPVIDLIDFDYTRGVPKGKSFWHTMADTPDKCSGSSMVKVGNVLLEWIKRQK